MPNIGLPELQALIPLLMLVAVLVFTGWLLTRRRA